jgi:TRAP-type C4-dicarboxylate transport system substrate-binding protein
MNKMAACLFAGTLLASALPAQGQEVLKFAVWTPEKELTYQTLMKPFAEAVTADAGGTLKIEMYPNGALGRNPAGQLKLMQDGVADIIWTIPSYHPDRFPDNDVFELPGIIQNGKEGSYAAWQLYEKGLLRGYEDYFVVSLIQAEPAAIHTSFPVRRLEDLRNKKIRTTGRVQTDAAKTFGIVPVFLAITEVTESISRGVIDGAITQPLAADDFGIARVAQHHYIVPFGSTTLCILMNKKKFESLPQKAKDAILKHRGMPMSLSWGKTQGEATERVIQKWQSNSRGAVVIASANDKAQFGKLTEPLIDAYAKEQANGTKLVSALSAELEAFRLQKAKN